MGFENFSYVEEEKRGGFKPLPVGDYRIRIESVEKVKTSTNKDMLKFCFEVSNSKAKIFHNIVDGEWFNNNISAFFDAFPQIKLGDFNLASWVGKVGACHTKQEEYNDKINTRVHYFIPASKQSNLPAWVEPEKAKNDLSDVETDADGFVKIPEGTDVELPF